MVPLSRAVLSTVSLLLLVGSSYRLVLSRRGIHPFIPSRPTDKTDPYCPVPPFTPASTVPSGHPKPAPAAPSRHHHLPYRPVSLLPSLSPVKILSILLPIKYVRRRQFRPLVDGRLDLDKNTGILCASDFGLVLHLLWYVSSS